MKNIYLGLAFCSVGLFTTTSCSDYLNTDSPSTVTVDVVMSSYDNCRSAMDGAYTSFHDVLLNQVFGAGLFYALDAAGSDIERHPGDVQPPRWEPESFYNGGNSATIAAYNPITYGKEAPSSACALLYSIISTTNILTDGITEEQLNGDKGADYHRVFAEAICMKATCYRELIKYYGDVPFMSTTNDLADHFTSRIEIYDAMITALKDNVDYLAEITATNKTTFTKQYGYALIGRLALEAAGYQTYRLDVTDASRLEKHPDYTDAQSATYARPTNYKSYYDIAYDAFKYVAENPGAITFDEKDYTTFFTQLHGADNTYADESIFEDEQIQGASGNCERSYSIGRPATGGSKDNYPCKNYGQTHINTAFYYGVFDPRDVRRDVACVLTGSTNAKSIDINGTTITLGESGKGGYECILPYDMATQAKGSGMACGKFDENRQKKIWTKNQRRSGINNPYMRISEVYLGLAEAALMKSTPDQSTADTYYNKTHERAGLPSAQRVTVEQVIDERGFEFAAEGDRRWTLIRSGFIGKKVKAIKELTAAMIAGLKNNGYYEFENKNVISNSIYIKYVDPKSEEIGLSSRLTPATPAEMLVAAFEPADDKEAVQFPGWRGQHDWENSSDYASSPFKDYETNPKSNVAIHGLLSRHTDALVTKWKNEGYIEQPWGSVIVENEDFYSTGIFQDWNYSTAPIYLFPFTTNALIGGLTNGYGFSSTF